MTAPDVPLHLDPCAVVRWMEEHSEWVLALPDAMTADELRALHDRFATSRCPSDDVFGEIAAHPNAPPDLLYRLARLGRWSIDLSLSVNPSAPGRLLWRLARSLHVDVLEHVVWNQSTPTTLLRRLAKHEDEHVRGWAHDALQERRGRPAHE